MKDRIEFARRVFAVFRRHFASPHEEWVLVFDGRDDVELGLSSHESAAGLAVLVEQQLIENLSERDYQLTNDGFEACLHPELVDELLGVAEGEMPQSERELQGWDTQNPRPRQRVPQDAASSTVLGVLRELIESSEIEAAKKDRWLCTIDDMARHPLAPALLRIAVDLAGRERAVDLKQGGARARRLALRE